MMTTTEAGQETNKQRRDEAGGSDQGHEEQNECGVARGHRARNGTLGRSLRHDLRASLQEPTGGVRKQMKTFKGSTRQGPTRNGDWLP